VFYTAVGLIKMSVVEIALCSVIIIVYTAQHYEQLTMFSNVNRRLEREEIWQWREDQRQRGTKE
jgi:hypothetical protein